MTSREGGEHSSPKEQADRQPDSRDASGGTRGVIPCNGKTPMTVGDHSASGSLVCKHLSSLRGSSILESHPTACAVGCILAPLRGSMRPVIFFIRLRRRDMPRNHRNPTARKVTDKTASPIFRSLPESLPPAKILLRGPANFRAPGVPARTRRDQTRPAALYCSWPPLVILSGWCRPPPAGVHSPVEPRSGFSDPWEPLLPGSGSTNTKKVPVPTSGCVHREITQGPTL